MSVFTRASASLCLVAIAGSATAQIAGQQPLVASTRVVYLEVAPATTSRALNVLKTYRQAAQKSSGVAHVEVLQQVGRPNFFAIHETWSDGASLQTHLTSADNRRLREDLQGALISPMDERVLAPIATEPSARGAITDQAIYVLTHADAAARREEIPGMLQEFAAGARRENGSVLFDATVQPTRTNHFTLIEVWRDQKAYETHVTTQNTRKFREAFAAVSGALYDERLYNPIK